MKKIIFSCLALMLISCIAFSQNKTDIEKEKKAIKAVIVELLNDRSEWNFEGYVDAWVDEPYSFISWAGKDGQKFIDWEDWKKNGKEEFASELKAEEEGGYSLTLEPFDMTIHVYKEAAWAHFKNNWIKDYKENGKTEDLGETFLILSFEKHDGEWKVAYLSAVISHSYSEDDPQAK